MSPDDIKIGTWYRAKDKRRAPRYVLYVSPDRGQVQFDDLEVCMGQHYPKRAMEIFLRRCGGYVVADGERYPVKNGWKPKSQDTREGIQ